MSYCIGHCAIPCSSGIFYIGGMLESEQTTSEVLHLNLFGMYQEKDFTSTENNSTNLKCSVVKEESEESVAHSSLLLSSFTHHLATSTGTSTSTSSLTCVPNNENSIPDNKSPPHINTHTGVHTHAHTVTDVHTQSPTHITTVPSTPLSTLHVDTHTHTSAHTDTDTHTSAHTVARTCTDNHHSVVPTVGVQKWDFLLSADSTPLGLKDDDDFYRRLSNLKKMNEKRTKIEHLKNLSFSRQYSLKEE